MECPRCGCGETFKSDCGWLSKPMEWCSHCGYLVGTVDDLAQEVSKALDTPVFAAESTEQAAEITTIKLHHNTN